MLWGRPKVALNKHLSWGYQLQERMDRHGSKVEDPLLKLMSWNLEAKVLIRDQTPAYYRSWEEDVESREGAAAQFIRGLEVLADICRKIGVR